MKHPFFKLVRAGILVIIAVTTLAACDRTSSLRCQNKGNYFLMDMLLYYPDSFNISILLPKNYSVDKNVFPDFRTYLLYPTDSTRKDMPELNLFFGFAPGFFKDESVPDPSFFLSPEYLGHKKPGMYGNFSPELPKKIHWMREYLSDSTENILLGRRVMWKIYDVRGSLILETQIKATKFGNLFARIDAPNYQAACACITSMASLKIKE